MVVAFEGGVQVVIELILIDLIDLIDLVDLNDLIDQFSAGHLESLNAFLQVQGLARQDQRRHLILQGDLFGYQLTSDLGSHETVLRKLLTNYS